jgi:hypothetical protein
MSLRFLTLSPRFVGGFARPRACAHAALTLVITLVIIFYFILVSLFLLLVFGSRRCWFSGGDISDFERRIVIYERWIVISEPTAVALRIKVTLIGRNPFKRRGYTTLRLMIYSPKGLMIYSSAS